MRAFIKVLNLVLLTVAVAAAARAQVVGFQSVSIATPDGFAIPVDIWYPTSGEAHKQPLGLFQQNVSLQGPVLGNKLALVVISHGNGGTKDEHYDTALALAKSGFVVAALEHTGDNYRDQSRATDLANRTRELHRLIDFMLFEWKGSGAIDPLRVGVFGFSSGGFTVLAAAGGEPDLSLVRGHCSEHPKYYDCSLLAAHPAPLRSSSAPNPTVNSNVVHDARIKALVVAAPALGFTFANGLSGVTQPLQLWRADDDKVLPAPDYADAVRGALHTPLDFRTVANAGHFDFLAPCTAELAKAAPNICTSETGFDREAFHERFNEAIVQFLKAHL